MLGEIVIGFLDSNLDQRSHDKLGTFDDLLVFKFTGWECKAKNDQEVLIEDGTMGQFKKHLLIYRSNPETRIALL